MKCSLFERATLASASSDGSSNMELPHDRDVNVRKALTASESQELKLVVSLSVCLARGQTQRFVSWLTIAFLLVSLLFQLHWMQDIRNAKQQTTSQLEPGAIWKSSVPRKLTIHRVISTG